MNPITINHCAAAPITFDLNDPEVQQLAAEMRVQHYHRENKHFIDIQLPEVSDED